MAIHVLKFNIRLLIIILYLHNKITNVLHASGVENDACFI